jgi:type I restriction enzyme S subunit
MDDTFLETDTMPPEWKVSRIGDEVEFTRKPRDLDISLCEAVPFIPMDLLPADGLYTRHHETRTPDQLTSGVFFTNGDILLAKITPCLENGKQAIAKDIPGGWGFATTEVFPIRPKSHDTEFLAFYLRVAEVRRLLATKMQGATGRQRLPREAVENFPVPVPPLPEQQAIAHVLRTVQQAKEATERIIDAARQLKQSLMRHLFTYGPVPFDQADQVPLKETEVGPVPEHWQVRTLGELLTRPQYGLTASAETSPVGPRFLRITDIQEDKVRWSTVPFCTCSMSERSKYALQPGDIVVARIGATTGKTYLVTEPVEAVYASYLIRLRPLADLDGNYLYQFTKTGQYWSQINESKGGRLKQGVNIPVLTGLMMPVPPRKDQKRIAATLLACDHKVLTEEARKVALEDVFQTLLHNLMTGKVRVHDVPAFAKGEGSNGHRQ